jgi:D-alanyl-D-alanine carboxypeptidase/D-alanyl-D-alanine-endopeptidase (penicillin-binding protein 4)
MIQYLNVVNHESHNLFAETIFKTMGKVVVGQGSFDGGARAVESFTARNVGLDHHDIVAVDGSGLSESNRVSAGGLVEILRYVSQSPQWDAFLSTLPEAGRTLRRMYSTRAARNLRAKTGTIEGVSALTGVVSARNGERLLFSILSNDVASTGAAKRIEDRIGSRLANFQRVLPETPTP